MKASELIKKFEMAIKEHGDMELQLCIRKFVCDTTDLHFGTDFMEISKHNEHYLSISASGYT